MRYRLRTLLILLAVLPPLIAYVGPYYVLSRRGYAYADSVNSPGFWFVPPQTKRDVKRNNDLIRLYYPLVRIEQLCGGRRHLAHEPCFFSTDTGLPP
jgi:hypothetical protein